MGHAPAAGRPQAIASKKPHQRPAWASVEKRLVKLRLPSLGYLQEDSHLDPDGVWEESDRTPSSISFWNKYNHDYPNALVRLPKLLRK